MWPFSKKKKWERLVQKGEDKLIKGNPKKALKYFRKALKCTPDKKHLYSKLIQAREKIDDEWSQTDFIEFMEWSLKEQEADNPALKQVYAHLSPEWEETWNLATEILINKDIDITNQTEKLVERGEIATRVLTEVLYQLVSSVKEGSDNE